MNKKVDINSPELDLLLDKTIENAMEILADNIAEILIDYESELSNHPEDIARKLDPVLASYCSKISKDVILHLK